MPKAIVYKKIIVLALKILIAGVAWWYIYDKIIKSAQDFHLITFSSDIWISFAVACILMPLNWILEAKKWHILIMPIIPISFLRAFRGTLIGMTFGFVTPNRIGDIGGRSIVLPSNKKQGVIASSIGSMLQFLVTILAGIFGMIFLFLFLPFSDSIQTLIYISFAVIVSLFVIIKFSFRKKYVQNIVLRIIGKSKYRKIVQTFAIYSTRVIYRAFGFGVLRYLVFSTQYCILLHALLPQLSIFQNIVGITLTYLFVTVIPSSILGELGVRGSVSVFIFGIFLAPPLPVFQVSLLMWAINLALPVFVGSLLLVAHKHSQNRSRTTG